MDYSYPSTSGRSVSSNAASTSSNKSISIEHLEDSFGGFSAKHMARSLSPQMRLPGVSIPRSMSPRFERTTEGDIEYSVAIDVHDLPPDDIKVSVTNRLVSVRASPTQPSHGSGGGSSFKEFFQEINLPENVDPKRIRSVYRKDGHLVLRAPLLKSDHQSFDTHSPHIHLRSSPMGSPRPVITRPISFHFPEEHLSQLSQREMQTASVLSHSPHLLENSREFFTSSSQSSSRRGSADQLVMGNLIQGGLSPSLFSTRIPLRMSNATPIPADHYSEQLIISPEFQASDLSVTIRDGVVHVLARREEALRIQEYKHEHVLPANVDGHKLSAKLGDGVLLLEAPFKSPEMQPPPPYNSTSTL